MTRARPASEANRLALDRLLRLFFEGKATPRKARLFVCARLRRNPVLVRVLRITVRDQRRYRRLRRRHQLF